MSLSLENIFLSLPLNPATINDVFMPPAHRTLHYLIIVSTFGASLAILIAKRTSAGQALKRALLISFFVSGLFSAVYGTNIWVRWVMADAQTFGGLSTEGKLRALDGGLYDMAQRAKPLLGSEYMRSHRSDEYLRQKFRFYVLPARLSDDAPVVVVLNDPSARLDLKRGTLAVNNTTYENIEPLLVYAQNAYIVRRK